MSLRNTFKSPAEKKELLMILNKHYGKHSFISKQFEMDSEKDNITFICDSFNEPLLTLSKLCSQGFIEFTVENIGLERARVAIHACDITALNKLSDSNNWPRNYRFVDVACEKLKQHEQRNDQKTENAFKKTLVQSPVLPANQARLFSPSTTPLKLDPTFVADTISNNHRK